jgi:hypothetical protein
MVDNQCVRNYGKNTIPFCYIIYIMLSRVALDENSPMKSNALEVNELANVLLINEEILKKVGKDLVISVVHPILAM